MTQIARDAGMAREALHRALSEDGNPEFTTVLMKALGLSLTVAPAKAA